MARPASVASTLLGSVALMALLLVSPAHAQLSLGAATNFAAGTNPIGIAIGDVNRDGRPDIVVTNGAPGTISVLLAIGDGTFGAPTAFAVGTMPVAVALGDLNRDGILDAVVVNAGSNSISILLGNGTGGFGAQTVIPVGAGPTAVAIGDLDGDGRLDVVVTNGGSGTVMVLRGNGSGGLTLVGEFPTGAAPSSVVLADVTGDNLLDVIVGNRDNGTVSVFPGVGGGLLGPPLDLAVGTTIVGVAVGDFNRDGRPDIAVAPGPGSLFLQLSDGVGGFRRVVNLAVFSAVAAVAITDFDGDGQADIMLLFGNGTTAVARGDGTGSFPSSTSVTGTPNPSALAVGDFDRDGLPDLVMVNPGANTVTVRLNTTVPAPAGSFLAAPPRLLSFAFDDPPQPVAVLLGDVQSNDLGRPMFDGILDTVVVDTSDVFVASGGSVAPAFPSQGATVAVLADLNRDGRPDLILGTGDRRISVRLGTGRSFASTNLGGSFGPPINTLLFFTPIAIAVGDLDGDGVPDLVVAGADSSTLTILPGAGNGSFGLAKSLFLGGSDVLPSTVAIADIDRDGVPDVIVAHSDGISIFFGDGSGGFSPRADFAVGVSALGLAVGDVNRDGKPDLVFSGMDGFMRVLLGNGAGAFNTTITIGGLAVAPSAVGLADFNRDGILDLVILDGGAGTLGVSRGNGGGGFGAAIPAPTGPDPAAFAIGDVNGDGRLDLVVVSAERQLRVLLNDGAGAGTIAFKAGGSVPSLVEANGSTSVTITRGGGTAPATVTLTATGTAVLNVDYQLSLLSDSGFSTGALPASGTLTFAQGEASKLVSVSTGLAFTDTVISPDRTIVLTLSNPGGGAVLGALSQQTITATERDEALSFSQSVFTITEGRQATVTVKRRGDLKGTVTVGLKTVAGSAAAADFVAANGTLTFPPGISQQTFVVKANADSLREGDETVALTLTAPKSTVPNRAIQLESPSVAQLTALDGNAAVVSFASASTSVAEGATTSVTLTRAGALAETATATVTVTLLSASATDFTLSPAAPATIVFGPGITSQTIQVAAVADTIAEGPENFRLQITGVTSGGRPGQIGAMAATLVTIIDDESAFSFSDPPGRQIPESAPTATFTVLRSGPLTGTATVQAFTIVGANGTAMPGQDFQTVAPTTLTFPPGVATRTFTVPLLNDTIVDGPKLLQVALGSPTGGPALGTQNNILVTLLDDDDGGVIQWQKAATSVPESAGTAVLTVTRTLSTPGRQLASGVTVNVAQSSGTAISGLDFTAPVGTLTFAAGQAVQTVTVPITNDTFHEAAETAAFRLTNPQGGATLGALVTTTLTITDDDEAGTIQFAAAAATVAEDNPSTVTLRITRTGKNLASAVTVDLAVAGGTAIQGKDYTLATGSLTFAAGEAAKDLILGRVNDALAEGPETIVLALDNPTGGATLAAQRRMLITLVGPESAVGFSLPAFSVAEGTTMATLTVLRTGALTAAATVQVRTVDQFVGGSVAVPGVDYLPLATTTLTFPPGMASRTLTVSILNNARRDGTRTVSLALSNPSAGLALGTQRTTVLTITDDDTAGTIGFLTTSVTVPSTAGVAVLTVTRTAKNLAGGVSVDFEARFVDFSNATASQPRQEGTIVFGPGQTSRTLTLPLSTDPRVRDERAFLQLSNPTGGAELGPNIFAQVRATRPNAGGTVRFTTSAMTVVEGSTALLTVTRTGGLAGGVSVPFSVIDNRVGGFGARAGLDFVLAQQGTLFFDEGDTSKTIAIPILVDALLEGPETFQVSLGSPQGGAVAGSPSQVIVTIVDNEAVVGFASGFVFAQETTPSVTVTVLRSGPLTGTATVDVRTVEGAGSGNAVPDVDYRPLQKTLTFGPGVATQTVKITLLNDTAVDGSRTVNLALGNAVGMALGTTQRTMAIVITDDENAGLIQLAANQFVASESAGVATIRVLRTTFGQPTPLGSGVTVGFVVTGGTATSGSDFTLTSGTVTFGAGETFKDIVIPLTVDGVAEGPEFLTVTLQNATGGAFVVGIASATVTIVD